VIFLLCYVLFCAVIEREKYLCAEPKFRLPDPHDKLYLKEKYHLFHYFLYLLFLIYQKIVLNFNLDNHLKLFITNTLFCII